MHNTHPHISTQEVSISVKNGEESRLENGFGRWVSTVAVTNR